MMNKKLVTFAITAVMSAPIAVYADLKISGTIQAEMVSLEVADGNDAITASIRDGDFDDMDNQTLTNDFWGSILNEGPNQINFDFDEKLGGGLTVEARYTTAFNTSGNHNDKPFVGEEAWVGLRTTEGFRLRYGTLIGAYKSSHKLIDPWAFTSLQARATGGGMSGEYFNKLVTDDTGKVTKVVVSNWDKQNGLTNDGFVEGALELGIKYSGFSGTIQGFVDDASNNDGAGLFELRFTAPHFGVWVAGAYTDLELTIDAVTGKKEDDGSRGNWKLGGYYQVGMTTFGLQYEDAEIGALDDNPDGGKYILGSFDYTKDSVTLAGWVSSYLSDINDSNRMFDANGNFLDEDALSWSLGVKYHFSKRTQIYAGFRQTDSDNDFRDENVGTLGIRHVFGSYALVGK